MLAVEGGGGGGCIRVGARVVYSRSKPKNLTLNSNNVRIDEFIDPGLQQFTGQTTHKNGERNIQNTELFPRASLDLLKKQTCLGKKIAQDLHIDFFLLDINTIVQFIFNVQHFKNTISLSNCLRLRTFLISKNPFAFVLILLTLHRTEE